MPETKQAHYFNEKEAQIVESRCASACSAPQKADTAVVKSRRHVTVTHMPAGAFSGRRLFEWIRNAPFACPPARAPLALHHSATIECPHMSRARQCNEIELCEFVDC
ncbi:hypothetical protein EVAR_74249_1 [Eumeta japonica]|uniref:Uncharacterized protein n=1 Tax=Eumeta variegata TaxID=151549 RepID=A0A4C1SCV3_EUMVA|nr:hypothetical protein EVAR_74249_1 [Eumeta japonica]